MRDGRGRPDADRILVYGVTGSGASTAALRIGEVTGLLVTLVTAQDRWVLDSSYGAWLDIVLPRVQLVVGLDYPRWFSLQRLIRLTAHGIVTGAQRCNGNTESLANALSRNSIVRWHFSSFSRKRERIRAWATSTDAPETLVFSTGRRRSTPHLPATMSSRRPWACASMTQWPGPSHPCMSLRCCESTHWTSAPGATPRPTSATK